MRNKFLMQKIVFIIVFWGTTLGFAQQKMNLRNSEILEELRIMKGVLGEMLSDNKNDLFSSNSIEGIYLPDYGMVFDVKTPKPILLSWKLQLRPLEAQRIALEAQKKALEESEKALPLVIKEMENALPSTQKELNEQSRADSLRLLLEKRKQNLPKYLEKQREEYRKRKVRILKKINQGIKENLKNIQEFLENYADVGDLLTPDQRITVFYDWDSTLDSTAISAPVFFSVKKTDILRFRSGKISKDQFWGKVEKGAKPSDEIQKQVEIMKRILKTGLKTTSNFSWGTSEMEAHVLPGYGVWFNLGNVPLGISWTLPSFASDQAAQADKKAKRQKAMRDYYSRVIKLIGQYGSSLRFLKPKQWIIVTFRSRSFSNGLKSTLYLLRVKNATVLKLRKKRIDFKKFRKGVELYEF